MKYYIDTEFLEGKQDKTIFGIKYGETKPIIDLISIGLVSEDNREYYAISKDFNLKEAWNRYDIVQCCEFPDECSNYRHVCGPLKSKRYWIRENVLKPIFNELTMLDRNNDKHSWFTYNNFKYLINKYGKTNKQIAEEICQFIDARWVEEGNVNKGFMYPGGTSLKQVMTTNVELYGYYSDYDWVVFCWLFGKMIDLPKGFPQYCIDLKQILDEKAFMSRRNFRETDKYDSTKTEGMLNIIKEDKNYPKQANEYNALANARWNKELHNFLNTL
jgi:hypothetical protein